MPASSPRLERFRDFSHGSQVPVGFGYCFPRRNLVTEIIDNLQVEGEFCKDDYCLPFKVVKQSAYPLSSSQPSASSSGNLWRYLHRKLGLWLYFSVEQGRHDFARTLWVYLKKFTPGCLKAVDIDEWVSWRFYINTLYGLTDEQVCSFLTLVDSFAFFEEQKAATQRAQSWQEWKSNAKSAPGMPKIHRFLNGPTIWQEFHCPDGGSGPQHDADIRAEPWHKLWQPLNATCDFVWPASV